MSVDGDDLADLLRVERPKPRQWATLSELDQVADLMFRQADADRLRGLWPTLEDFLDWIGVQDTTDPYVDPQPDWEAEP